MKRFSVYVLAVIMLAVSHDAMAASMTDTAVQLHTVTIDTTRYHRGEILSWSTTTINGFKEISGRKASEALADFSGIYLKNYGVGQLSSVSLRGGSAAQTELQWNGIKLNNPNTGQVDMSLFDLGTGDKLSISDRANSIAGVIAIDNELKTARSYTLRSDNTIRLGSFGERCLSSYNVYGFHGFAGSTRVSYLGADNDFTFKNDSRPGAPLMRESNAATRLLSMMQQVQYSFPKAVILGADFWMTDADRQLPPVMAVDQNSERQWDRSYRALLHLAGRKGQFRYALKSAYLYDWLHYVDTATTIDSRSASHSLRNIFTARYELGQSFVFEGQAHYDREMAQSSGYDRIWFRDLLGMTLGAQYHHKTGFNTKISVSLEMKNDKVLPVPIAVNLGYIRKVRYGMVVCQLGGSHAYRLPSLNDLYWKSGGNPSLRPEEAWKGNLHGGYVHSYWLRILADGFYSYVRDWIQWAPQPGSAVWTAQNLKRVLSRGATVEIQLQSRRDMNDKAFSASGSVSYTYTNTISLDPISVNDNSKGKQLIYVPLHNLVASFQVQYRYFYLRVVQSYTGLRFTTTDNSQSLHPYLLTHLEIGKEFYLQGQRIGLSFRINNIANSQYQLVSQRPMPGRAFEGTIKFNLSR